ncbi:MAG: hypothetical protein ACYS6K_24305 [Planctomycetota bacterium]
MLLVSGYSLAGEDMAGYVRDGIGAFSTTIRNNMTKRGRMRIRH